MLSDLEETNLVKKSAEGEITASSSSSFSLNKQKQLEKLSKELTQTNRKDIIERITEQTRCEDDSSDEDEPENPWAELHVSRENNDLARMIYWLTKWAKEKVKEKSTRYDPEEGPIEPAVDMAGSLLIPFYSAICKNSREKRLEKTLEHIIYHLENWFKPKRLAKIETNEKNNIIKFIKLTEEKMSGLEEQLNEARCQLKKAVEENRRKEQEDAEEIQKLAKAEGEIQKALLSAEKSEIEQLKAERNQLRTTTEEQEKFLSRLFKEYENLELRRKLAINGWECLLLNYKKRGRENVALLADNEGLKEAKKNLTKARDKAREEREKFRDERDQLENELISLEFKIEKEKKLRQNSEEKLASLGYPVWFDRTTTFLGVESANQIWGKGVFLGRFALIILVGAILFYISSWVLRILVGTFKNLKAIFTKKQDTAAVLKDLLTGMKEAKNSIKKKQENQPAAISKQPVKPEEILPQISSEKTEVEKSAQNGKNGKKTKKKKKNR